MELDPDRVAGLTSAIGREEFSKALLGLFDPAFEFSHCTAFERRDGKKAPSIALATSRDRLDEMAMRDLTSQWVEEDYVDDPLLVDVERVARVRPEVHFGTVIGSPDHGGARARIVEKYYDRFDIGDKATYTMRDGDRVVCVSLYRRRGGGPLSTRQRTALGRMSSLVLKSVERHSEVMAMANATMSDPFAQVEPVVEEHQPLWQQSRSDMLSKLRVAFLMQSKEVTAREAEICAYIAMGYTTFAIGLVLGISQNTVATHRKRAYSKLKLSSQAELFQACLRYLVN